MKQSNKKKSMWIFGNEISEEKLSHLGKTFNSIGT